MTTSFNAFEWAVEQFAKWDVDVEQALSQAAAVPISMHCWQGDDVRGFETGGGELGDGLAVTGNYPGRATTPDELRTDFEHAAALVPGAKRLNLHALYAETDGARVDRDALEPRHFQRWIEWAGQQGYGLDFNPSFFSHPQSSDGFTLSHRDPAIRSFWIDHGIASRRIAAAMGEALQTPCVNNIWIPDGYKDVPADRHAPRERLMESLDAMLADDLPRTQMIDAVESKLFGIGSESYVVGSHEFYMGYAIRRQIGLCLDAGHFHPTEGIADKLSSVLLWVPHVLLHVSRGVRWDSDHVVIVNDDLLLTAQELVRSQALDRISLGLDFFDASINRIAAWIIGSRAMRKALLQAFLEPFDQLREAENEGDYTRRLACLEEIKTLPYGIVWDELCRRHDQPAGLEWLNDVRRYEADVLSKRA